MTFANLLKITHANQGVHDPDANLHCKLDPRSISRNTNDEVSYLWNDNAALKSCSLTCQPMAIPSQKHLFYCVAICPLPTSA